jgi:hypothetical protein
MMLYGIVSFLFQSALKLLVNIYSVEITQVYQLFFSFSGDSSHPALLQILRRYTGKLH